MKSRMRELLERAVNALMAAIEIYNKPDFFYREEAFAILSVNAWELLLKAKWLKDHNNKVQCLYIKESKGKAKQPRYKKTRSGAKMTWGIEYLAKKLVEKKELHPAVLVNLQGLIEFRDTAVHYYHRSQEIEERVLELGLACLKNFLSAANEWFQVDLSHFKMYIMPLTINPIPQTTAFHPSKNEETFIKYLESLRPDEEDPASPYLFSVNVEIRFVRSKDQKAVPIRTVNDPNAPAVQIKEEDILERYPWDYRELTARCKKRYKNFKINKEYHKIRQSLEKNKRFAHERRLNPEKPRPKKTFYSPAILEELDKHFEKK